MTGILMTGILMTDKQVSYDRSGHWALAGLAALALGATQVARAQIDERVFRHGFEGGREPPASQTIGAGGGELVSTDGMLMLIVPDGALDQETAITITQLTGDAIPLALSDPSVGKVYDLQPDGLEFLTPASLAAITTGSPDTGVPLIGLFNKSGDTLELLGTAENTVENTVDSAGILATAQIEHFSEVAVAGSSAFRAAPGELDGVIFRCEVEPNPVPVGGDFTVTLEIETSADSQARGGGFAFVLRTPTGSAARITQDFDPPGFSLNAGEAQTITRTATGTCDRAGKTELNIFLEGDEALELFVTAVTIGGEPNRAWEIDLRKTINCVDPDEPPTAKPQTGVFPLSILTALESIQVLNGLVQAAAFANLPPGSVPLLVRGDEGFAIFDLLSGDILLDRTGGGSSADVTPLGAVGVTRPDGGPETPAALFSYALDRAFSPFGGFLLGYDTENMQFSNFGQSVPGSFIDAFPAGGDPVADEVVVVDNQGVGFIQFDVGNSSYSFAPEELRLDNSRYGNQQLATAYAEVSGGPLLTVTAGNPGRLFFDDRSGDMATEIGELGEAIRRIRCEMPVCAATDFTGGAINIITWDGQNMPTIVGDPVAVGDGPVDLDGFPLTNGNRLFVTNGFNDNTATFTEVDTAGNVVAQDTYDLPTGILGPGHPVFLADPDAPDDPFVLGTGFFSDSYFVTKQSELASQQ